MSEPIGGRLQIFTSPSFPPVATRPIVIPLTAAAAAAELLHGSIYTRSRVAHTQTRKQETREGVREYRGCNTSSSLAPPLSMHCL
jgi:hypothetical protein